MSVLRLLIIRPTVTTATRKRARNIGKYWSSTDFSSRATRGSTAGELGSSSHSNSCFGCGDGTLPNVAPNAATGAPHFGQVVARVLTSLPQSGHLIRGIRHSPVRREERRRRFLAAFVVSKSHKAYTRALIA